MEVKLYVGNLPRSMTGKEVDALFTQAGDVTEIDIVTDRLDGGTRGYAFVTMSAQSEGDKAVSMFNAYSLDGYQLRVGLVKTRARRGFVSGY
jgi:RNA recognition motif-containing protein